MALLVRSPLDSLLPLLALGIDALLRDAVLDAAEAGTGVVALLARLPALRARLLHLAPLRPDAEVHRGVDEARVKGVHVRGERRVDVQGVLEPVLGGIELIVVALVGVGVDVGHGSGLARRLGGAKGAGEETRSGSACEYVGGGRGHVSGVRRRGSVLARGGRMGPWKGRG